jgi:hypothetical protein
MAWVNFPLSGSNEFVHREPFNELREACIERGITSIPAAIGTGRKWVRWSEINSLRTAITNSIATGWWGSVSWSSPSSYSVKKYVMTSTTGSNPQFKNIFEEAFGGGGTNWRSGGSRAYIRHQDLNDIYLVLNCLHTKPINTVGTSPNFYLIESDFTPFTVPTPAPCSASDALDWLGANASLGFSGASSIRYSNWEVALSTRGGGYADSVTDGQFQSITCFAAKFNEPLAVDIYIPFQVTSMTDKNGAPSSPSSRLNLQLRAGPTIPTNPPDSLTMGSQLYTIPISGLLNGANRIAKFANTTDAVWITMAADYQPQDSGLAGAWSPVVPWTWYCRRHVHAYESDVPMTGQNPFVGRCYARMNYSKLAA